MRRTEQVLSNSVSVLGPWRQVAAGTLAGRVSGPHQHVDSGLAAQTARVEQFDRLTGVRREHKMAEQDGEGGLQFEHGELLSKTIPGKMKQSMVCRNVSIQQTLMSRRFHQPM